MARWIFLALAVGALCACLGEGLQCHTCDICTILNKKNVTCGANELCGKEITAGIPSGQMCLNKTMCNTQHNKTVAFIDYKVKYACCDTDLCEPGSATSARLSLLAGLSAVAVLCFSI